MSPTVTISLVTYNGERWLPGCLASVAAQRGFGADEVQLVVLDNASTDRTLALLRAHVAVNPGARLIESTVNVGYAAAHNRVIRESLADFVLLLNQDVELDPDFVRNALGAFEGRPRTAAVQGRVRRLGQDGTRSMTLDTTGLHMARDRRFTSRDAGRADQEGGGPASVPGAVFGADGPAPLYRRAALVDAELPRTAGGTEVLDEDFFMYKEDVDLAWRLRLLGWDARYEPTALAWHARTAAADGTGLLAMARSSRTIPRWILARSWRNQRLMQIKNERAGSFLRDLPWILRREVLSLGFMVVADPLRLSAIPATLRAAPSAVRKRRALSARLAQRANDQTGNAPA